jgi:rhamnosyltransferase
MKPKILVVLAAFNGEKWLEAQIETILSQTDVDVNLVISVDSSSDGTELICNKLAAEYVQITLLPCGLCFGGAAPNFYRLIRDVGLEGYDYLGFADQDDIWFPDKLKRACALLKAKRASAYSGDVIAFWDDGRQLLVKKSQTQVKWDYFFEAAGPGCTYVLDIKLANELQIFFNKNSDKIRKVESHDWLIYAFARANNFSWVIDDCPKMMYRQHTSNQVGVNSGVRAQVRRLRKVLNGWWFSQALLIGDVTGKNLTPIARILSSESRLRLFKLALYFRQCRRRRRDQLFFLGAALLMPFLGGKIDHLNK